MIFDNKKVIMEKAKANSMIFVLTLLHWCDN